MAVAVDFAVQEEVGGITREEFDTVIDECSFMQGMACNGTDFGHRGDSGGTVLKLQNGSLAFEGLLSNMVEREAAKNEKIGLYIPSDVVFDQMQKRTAVGWDLG
jgi:hypothetical protein